MFTVQAIENCDCLQLTVEDLDLMYAEFPSICRELIQDAEDKLNKQVGLKVKLIRDFEYDIAKKSPDIKDKLSAIFMAGLHRTLQNMETPSETVQEPAATPFRTTTLKKKKSFSNGAMT